MAVMWPVREGVRVADAAPPPSRFVARLLRPPGRVFGPMMQIGRGFPQQVDAVFGAGGRLFVLWRRYPDQPPAATTVAEGAHRFTAEQTLEVAINERMLVVRVRDGRVAVAWSDPEMAVPPGTSEPPLPRFTLASPAGVFGDQRRLEALGLTDLIAARDGLVAFTVDVVSPGTIRPRTLAAMLGSADGDFGAPERISASASGRPIGVAIDPAERRLVVAYPCEWEHPAGSVCASARALP